MACTAAHRDSASFFLENTFIDQNDPTQHTAGPLIGAHRNWTYGLDQLSPPQCGEKIYEYGHLSHKVHRIMAATHWQPTLTSRQRTQQERMLRARRCAGG